MDWVSLMNELGRDFATRAGQTLMNKLRRKEAAKPDPPPGPTPDQKLLTEIRDLLRDRSPRGT